MVKGALYIFLAALFWGFFPVIGRLLFAEGIDALSVSSMRITLAGIIYLLYGICSKRIFTVKKKDLPFFFLYGLLAATCLPTFYLSAVSLLSTAEAAILLYSAPVIVTICSRIFFKEPITSKKLVALVLTLTGCVLVVGIPGAENTLVNWRGILYGILSGVCYASFTLLGKVGLQRYDGTINAIVPTIFGGLCFLVIKPMWAVPMKSIEIFGLYWAIAIVGTVIPVWFYLRGMQKGIKGTDASVIATFEPVFAALFGTMVFHDHIGAVQILGILFVFLGASLPILDNHFLKNRSLAIKN